MNYSVIPPPEKLRPWVRFFWVLEGNAAAGTPYIYRSMADGCAELVFHYQAAFTSLSVPDGDRPLLAMVHAPSQAMKRFVTHENFGIFGVYLYPFAIPHFFKLPPHEAIDQLWGLADLLGSAGRELEEQIMLAPGTAQRIAIVTDFLAKRQTPPKDEATLACIQRVIHGREPKTVQQLASQFNLSTRQLERKFKEYTGFPPKLFSRIIRFQATLKEYSRFRTKSLTEIAYDCGYYDQSHFIHDFKAFSGYYPKQYFAGQVEGIEVREA